MRYFPVNARVRATHMEQAPASEEENASRRGDSQERPLCLHLPSRCCCLSASACPHSLLLLVLWFRRRPRACHLKFAFAPRTRAMNEMESACSTMRLDRGRPAPHHETQSHRHTRQQQHEMDEAMRIRAPRWCCPDHVPPSPRCGSAAAPSDRGERPPWTAPPRCTCTNEGEPRCGEQTSERANE